jgi:hypothetical protein
MRWDATAIGPDWLEDYIALVQRWKLDGFIANGNR